MLYIYADYVARAEEQEMCTSCVSVLSILKPTKNFIKSLNYRPSISKGSLICLFFLECVRISPLTKEAPGALHFARTTSYRPFHLSLPDYKQRTEQNKNLLYSLQEARTPSRSRQGRKGSSSCSTISLRESRFTCCSVVPRGRSR